MSRGNMTTLLLADLKDCEKPLETIANEFKVHIEQLGIKKLLIGYIGSWGYDSTAWILFTDLEGNLKEVNGSHCSCYGFEGQWEPKDSSVEYLKSKHFSIYLGGYDDNADENMTTIKEYINTL